MVDRVVIVKEPVTNVDVTPAVQPTVGVSSPGARGPAGPTGPTGGTPYVHTQSSASTTWTVTHNLGRHPASVTVWIGNEDSTDGVTITHVTINQLTVTLGTALTGEVQVI